MFSLQRRSVRQKLNYIVVLTTFLALLLAGLALVLFDLRNQARTVEADLLAQADVVGLASAPALVFEDAEAARENLSVLRGRASVAAAALYNAQGRVFATFVPSERQGRPVPERAAPAGVSFDREWVVVWRPVVSNKETIGSIYLQARHELLSRALDYLGVLVLVMAGSLAAALIASNRLRASLIAPIVSISEVAQNIMRHQDFGLRAEKTTDDEVGALVDVFNAMLAELGQRAQTLEQANQALRASDARFQLAVRGSSAGLWDWDMLSGSMFYSPRFKSMMGYSDDEFPNVPAAIEPLLHPQDLGPVREALRAHLSLDRPYQVEARLRDKVGHYRWFLIAGMALRNEQGEPYRMAGSLTDITERKEFEQSLREANRAKDEFIATLAHELRNPLAPIRTGLEILKKDLGNGPASQRARDIIERQLLHMIRLVDDLLDISRVTSGKIRLEKARIGLRAAIDSAVETSRPAIEAGRHALSLELPAQDVQVEGDLTRIAQSVGNLLNNAAKYTPPGGHIALRLRQEGMTAVIEVQDDGVGIPADMLEKVFSLFAQVGKTIDRSQGGLGIGLSLVRSLVELHGGTVTAASPGPNQGSTFTLRIPCLGAAPAPAEPAADPAAMAAAVEGALRVLVVDDNVDAAETMAAALEISGHSIRTVFSGLEVLDAASGFDPDLVLLDIGLPGMNGYEVARQLRADPRFDHCLLVALTGWGSKGDRQRAREAGFDHHLTKPVNFSDLDPLLERARHPA